MANLYYSLDQGAVIFENGEIYERTGQVLGAVNDVLPDVANIQPVSFNTPDAQGMTDYSAVQYAVARYKNFHTYDDFDDTGWASDVSGILRAWSGSADQGLKINDIIVGGRLSGNHLDAFPINVQVGDVVKIYRRGGFPTWGVTGYFHILPFIYP